MGMAAILNSTVLAGFILLILSCDIYAGETTFRDPQPVSIVNLPKGYNNTPISTEEPFVSRDGKFLFFNSGDRENHKDLHFAEWKRGHWQYRGEVDDKVNTAKEVEGNPTMDASYNFFYIDSSTKTMVRKSHFYPITGKLGALRDEKGVPERVIKPFKRFVGTMGVEVSADGDTLYFSRATWQMRGLSLGPFEDSDILFSQRKEGKYLYDEAEAKRVMQYINTPDMEYAASISADGLELFFTRLSLADLKKGIVHSQIMTARRSNRMEAFSKPQPIVAIGGDDFVEGPSIAPDGRELYYHRRVGEKFRLYKVTRGQ
jgi:hypothetical protein